MDKCKSCKFFLSVDDNQGACRRFRDSLHMMAVCIHTSLLC